MTSDPISPLSVLQPDDTPDFMRSVAGEEDPGASLDAAPGGCGATAVKISAITRAARASLADRTASLGDAAHVEETSPRVGVFRLGLVAGAWASAASTIALSVEGWRHTGSLVAATNATSHWLWGDSAFAQARPSWRHTGLGYLIHHSTSTFWAFIYAVAEGRRLQLQGVGGRLLSAGLAAAMACLIDYTITPRRLTPGYERHLSRGSMVAVYALFAVGLAVGSRWAQSQPGSRSAGGR